MGQLPPGDDQHSPIEKLPPFEPTRRRTRARRSRRARYLRRSLLATVALIALITAFLSSSKDEGDKQRADRQVTTVKFPLHKPSPPKKPSARPIKPAVPGRARVIFEGPKRREVALTFDDGFCAYCVSKIVRTLDQTGAHATFFPNGVYGKATWDKERKRITRMVEEGRLVIGNHTWNHPDSVRISAEKLRSELQANEDWVQRTFNTTSRPYFRPPFGNHNAAVRRVAGQLGFTRVMMWSGEVPYTDTSAAVQLNALMRWARPGVIILLHANRPATANALPEMIRILKRRKIKTVTLDEMLRPRHKKPARVRRQHLPAFEKPIAAPSSQEAPNSTNPAAQESAHP